MKDLIINEKVLVVDPVVLVDYINERVKTLLETKVLVHGNMIDVENNYRKNEVNKCLKKMKKREIQYVLGVSNEMVSLIRAFDNLEINPNFYNFVRHIQDTYGIENNTIFMFDKTMSYKEVLNNINNIQESEITFEKSNGLTVTRKAIQTKTTKQYNLDELNKGNSTYLYFIDPDTDGIKKCIFDNIIDISKIK